MTDIYMYQVNCTFPLTLFSHSQFDSDYFIVDKVGSSESGQ